MRGALTPEEAGRLLAQFPLFWWDHVLCLLGTGLRIGELAGLRRRRIHLDCPCPCSRWSTLATRRAGSAAASSRELPRTYHTALAKLADPTGELRPTAARILKALRDGDPQTTDQLTAALAGRRAIRPATIQVALGELVATGLSGKWRS